MSTPTNSSNNERTVPRPNQAGSERTVPQGGQAQSEQTVSQSHLTRDQSTVARQSQTQDEQRAVQEGTPNVTREVQQAMKPIFPQWPRSKPGPQATPPPPGMRPINGLRPEQVVEVGYNQVTGEPSTQDPVRYFPDESKGSTSTDEQVTAQDVMRRGKERL